MLYQWASTTEVKIDKCYNEIVIEQNELADYTVFIEIPEKHKALEQIEEPIRKTISLYMEANNLKLSPGTHRFNRINGTLEEYLNEEFRFEQIEGVSSKTETDEKFDYIAEVPVVDVESIAAEQKNGITKHEAEQLCSDVLGDKAEENGFPISYRCISAVSSDDKFYYVMHITWLVDNNHWSYIGNCYVSSDGQEIFDGIVSSEKYEITGLRWKK